MISTIHVRRLHDYNIFIYIIGRYFYLVFSHEGENILWYILLLIYPFFGMLSIEEWAGQEEIGCAVPASTWISKRGMLASIVDTQSLVALTHQHMCWQDQGTGTALPWIVVLTTMPADPAAIDVVHIKMIILPWQPLQIMEQMPVSHLDGNLVTGFAIGEFNIHSHLLLSFQQIMVF